MDVQEKDADSVFTLLFSAHLISLEIMWQALVLGYVRSHSNNELFAEHDHHDNVCIPALRVVVTMDTCRPHWFFYVPNETDAI